MPRISPGAIAERDAVDRAACRRAPTTVEVARPRAAPTTGAGARSDGAVAPRVLRVERERDVAPHHRARDRLRRRARASACAPTVAPGAHHRDRVGDLDHLVELVRDEHDRAAVVAQRAQHRPQLLHLGRRQHRGRLVEDEDPRAAIERLQDLDALRLADRQLGDQRVAAARRARCAALSSRTARSARGAVERRPARELAAEHDVLGDGERGHEHEVLVHHADAGGDRVARRPAGDVAARSTSIVPASGGIHARRACASASTCRRRSRRRARGSRRARPRAIAPRFATTAPKRLVDAASGGSRSRSAVAVGGPLIACSAPRSGRR